MFIINSILGGVQFEHPFYLYINMILSVFDTIRYTFGAKTPKKNKKISKWR